MTVGYALGPNDGEHLILRGGSIFIKAGSCTPCGAGAAPRAAHSIV